MRATTVFLFIGAACLMSACMPATGPGMHNGRELPESRQIPENLGTLTYQAVERLAQTASPPLSIDKRVFVASMVDINDLERSSTLGRLVGEHAGSKLTHLGYDVRELRLRSSILMRDGVGDLILSRDLRRITRNVEAAAVVAGTYAVGGQWIYVNLRMIAPENGKLLSAVDFAAPLDDDTRCLLAQ